MDLILKKKVDKEQNITLIKKKIWYFGKYRNLCKIRLLKKKSNTFILFQDCKDKIIATRSAGSAGIIGNKRKKKAAFSVEQIFISLYPYLKLYSITRVALVLNTRVNSHYRTLLRTFRKLGISVVSLFFDRRIAFNGCRLREKRRL